MCDAQKLVDNYCYSYDGKIRENPTFQYVQQFRSVLLYTFGVPFQEYFRSLL